MNAQDLKDLAFVAHELAQPDSRPILTRKRLSERLLSLFKADFLGQTQWNSEKGVFEKPICYNRDEDMSLAYESHFQFCDPLSHTIRGRPSATATYEVISRAALEKTEYHADFLRPNKVAHGLDQYLFDAGRNIGDLRIWRKSASREFTQREKNLLAALRPMLKNAYLSMLSGDRLEEVVSRGDMLAIAFSADLGRKVLSPALIDWIAGQAGLDESLVVDCAMTAVCRGDQFACFDRFDVKIARRNVPLQSHSAVMCTIVPKDGLGLSDEPTPREMQVGFLVGEGWTDREIAGELGISYWTVRTHVGNLLRKLNVRNRVELAGHHQLRGSKTIV